MNKTAIADVLSHIATLLELTGENPFKIRAYISGARQLQSLEQSELETLLREERLQSVKGIGAALAQQIGELHATGRSTLLEQLQASIAPGLVEMLEVPGLGPKKVKAIHDQLGITTLTELTAACNDGRVAELAGFGAKTQEKILAGIRNREAYGKRHLWWAAQQVAEPIIAGLRALPQVSQAEAAGSLRRCMETVGDLDFIVAATDVAPVVEWFVTQPGVQEVTARGDTKASVRFDTGLQADLRLVPPEQFAFALHHFTGSKDHNVQMRQRALSIGLSLSEWGLVLSTGEGTTKEKAAAESLPAASESALFTALGLAYIPPELREGRGEIEAAEADALPNLIELDDLRGAFHNHTTASDGNNTLEEMTAAADALGRVHRQIRFLLRNGQRVRVRCTAGVDRDVPARGDDAIECTAIDDEVAQHGEGLGAPRLDVDLVAVLEVAHVQLARRHAAVPTVGDAVDHHRAHAADALAAVVIEGDRLFALRLELLVERVHHLEERHVLGHVLDVVRLHRAGLILARLAPHVDLQLHQLPAHL